MKSKMIKDVVDEFLWHCRYEKALDQKTIKAYRVDLNQFVACVSLNTHIHSLSKFDVKCFLSSIECYQPKTITRKIASLKAMLNYYECEDDGFVNPMRRMQIKIKLPVRIPVAMTLEEIREILKMVYSRKNNAEVDNFVAVRDVAIIELLFASGMRVSELCSLCNKDVDVIHGTIKIIGKGNKERIVHICQTDTLNALLEWNSVKTELSPGLPYFINRLNNRLSTQSVRLMIRKLANKCGFNKHVTPHTFRHTFATLLLEEDVDIKYIQHLLGHSSIVTTQIYTHVNLHKQRQILSDKHPRRLL